MRRLRHANNASGLTLIEMLVSILIFALMTLGIAPLLMTSLRGSAISRTYTIGKNFASETMERVRGLAYFESVKNQTSPKRRDVLDLYFPNLVAGSNGSGYSPANGGTFKTICSATAKLPAGSGPLACPPTLPAGYELDIVAMFAQPGPVQGGEQTYVAATPKAGYDWSSVLTEVGPSNLIQITVTSRWTFQGRPRSFQLQSLVGDRQLAPERMRAQGIIDYVLRISTAYRDGLGRISYLVGVVGHSDSSITSRATTTADQTVRTARFSLAREQTAGADGVILFDQTMGETVLHAGTNQFPTADVPSASVDIFHPDLPATRIAYVDQLKVEGASTGVQVVNELPKALGRFSFTGTDVNRPTISVDNQKSLGDNTDLRLDANQPVLSMERGTAGNRIRGSTTAEGTALSPPGSRKVESTVNAEFSGMFLFPTQSGVVTPAFITDTSERRSVVAIRDFRADLTCRATANNSTALVSGTWSARVKYWRDSTNDGSTNGAYQELTVQGSTTATGDPLAAVVDENPLVYDALLNSNDVYLFRTATRKGYLESITSKPRIETSQADTSGRSREAAIRNAIQIITYRTDPDNQATSLNVSIGNLSCAAVDKRGF